MRRLLLGMALVALVVLAIRAADTKKPEDKDGKEAASPTALFKDLAKKFQSASSREEKEKVIGEYAPKFLSFEASHHKTEEGVQALTILLQLPLKGEQKASLDKAVTILKKDYVKLPLMAKAVRSFPVSPWNNYGRDVLQAVVEQSPDKTTKAYAVKKLMAAAERARDLGDKLDQGDLKKKIEEQLGKDALKTLQANAASADKDIKAYKARLEGDLKGVLVDLSEGKPAPEVVSQDVDGKKVKLSDLKGKVVVLDFWATWCGPCKSLIPHTRELVKKMKGKPFVFVSVSADEDKKDLVDFLKENPMPWPQWWSGTGGVVADWEIESYPTIFIIDAKGIIRKKFGEAGDATARGIDETVEMLVKEAEKAKSS